MALQLAEKLVSATDSYQGMTLVMPQRVENRVRALQAAEKLVSEQLCIRARLQSCRQALYF